jgi:hypothetical protein
MVPSLGGFSDRLIGAGIAWHCTRDITERIDYYRVEKPDFASNAIRGGGTSVPHRQGPLPGRRRE